ncbi:MAG: hypothetical protein AAF193_11930 [Bacteroidota bacterium]
MILQTIVFAKVHEYISKPRRKRALMAKKKKVKKKKVFELVWAFEAFEHLDGFFTKRMFGGLAAYAHQKMVMMLSESPGEREYRGDVFDFDIWNGILFPTEYEYQESLQKEFPELIQHPVLKKWLYLPLESQNFEDIVEQCSQSIRRNDPRFGIFPKMG